MKCILASLIVLATCGSALTGADEPARHSYMPAQGYVPDAATAVTIAIAVLSPIYGASKIKGEAPFIATLKDGVWIVSGTLPPNMYGGVAVIDISRTNGTILRVSHGK
ncbi:NTF2 fold immunity protein [Massilia rubra]|uniref:NTF2 fold domain-containing protein n=1 Tax=Massilia rubra TaxID=2607910 RepID=A0ABX0LXU8_9BURK|nr:NTF2 fold immunity protein [Massilia rubra]NHZ37155.1 hypothetical protein [Massilia rubra]